ncbi:MAG: hypothetical protein ACK2U9_11480, partial [Anaerolineae bacterium]
MNENRNQNRNLILILGALVVVVVCCCLFVLAAGGLWFGLRTPVSSSSVPYPAVTVEVQVPPAATSESGLPTATPKASPGSGSSGSSLPEEAPDSASIRMTEQALADAVVPARDLRVLAERLRGTGPIPEVVDETPANFQVGDTQTFWVSNDDSQEHFQIDAELVYVNDVLYIWVEKGVPYNLNDIKASADRFANETYPTNRNFFGSEWSPGVDGDPRLHILHSEQLGDRIAGYFSGADEVSHLAQPFSNEREMFYINIGNTEPNSQFYNGVLSHEFQHMIHWYQDKNESTWVNEGMSELATELNGYSRGGADTWFSELPDTQLNAWDDAPDARTEHYGNAYLFMSYFLQRFGNEMTQAVVASDANGIDGFNDVLTAENAGLTFDDVFADWVIANYLDDPSLEDGRYGYQRDDLEPMALDASHRRYPIQREAEVHQYATDYVELNGSGDLQVDFHGATTTRLASNEPHSGQFSWWANRVDDSDARLTRAF